MIRRASVSAFVLLLVLPALGCVTASRVPAKIEAHVQRGDYAAALAEVELEREGEFRKLNAKLLYFLERGMLLHLDGQYAASNAAFEEAKRVGHDLYTKSVTDETFSLVSNDYALDYAGENFERTLIHLFAALNYSRLGDRSAALVEARQVGEYLRKLQTDTKDANVYQEDAFARYLAAMLYEADGEDNDAHIAFKKAAEGYVDYGSSFGVGRPASLMQNAERVASRLGAWAVEDLERLGSRAEARVIPKGHGELVVLHYNGLSPTKEESKWRIPFSEAWPVVLGLQAVADDDTRDKIGLATTIVGSMRGVDVVPVAYPVYVRRDYVIATMEPRVAGAAQMTGPELVEDIGAIAEKDLEDRIARIKAKAVARAAIKYAIQKGAEALTRQEGGYGTLLTVGTQLAGNILRELTEKADTRVWSSLPDKIWMSAMVLPAGRHDLEVDFLAADSRVVESRSVPGIEIGPGERKFVVVRTVK